MQEKFIYIKSSFCMKLFKNINFDSLRFAVGRVLANDKLDQTSITKQHFDLIHWINVIRDIIMH